jgi:hypothetical protein
MSNEQAEKILAELARINARLDELIGGKPVKMVRRRDPNFRQELQHHLDQHRMNQSDLAAHIWGRDKEGRAINRDRISVWLSGKSYPSRCNYQKILDVFNLV